MRKALCGWLCVGLLGAGLAARGAQAPAAPADVEALKKQMLELRAKERECWTKLREITAKIQQAPELVKLRKAFEDADKAYQEKTGADPAVAAARKAEAEARTALQKLVREKLAASDQAKAIHKQLEGIDDRRAHLDFQNAVTRLELTHRSSPINRALAKDPELPKLKKAADDAYRAARQATAKEARQAATEAYETARKAYDAARNAKLAAMPDAKKLLNDLEETRTGGAELRNDERDARDKLSPLRRDSESGDDEDVQAARQKSSAARKAERDATNAEPLKATRKLRDDARRAYYNKSRELMAADKTGSSLSQQTAALRKQINDAQRQLREAQKGGR